MKKVRAAVTTRVVQEPNYHEIRDSISHDLINFLYKQNINPVLIPNSPTLDFDIVDETDILIISGGNDILDNYSNKEIEEDSFLKAVQVRNNNELELIRRYISASKPIFGICHGLQIINHYYGGNLKLLDSSNKHVNNEHKIKLTDNYLKELFSADEVLVNSYHNYVIDTLGQDLEILGLSDDGVIEAIGNEADKIFAIMWHPERSFSDKVAFNFNSRIINYYMDFIK